MAAPNLLTTKDVAELLRVHPKHVYRLMRRGLPALRVGDEWRFARDGVLAWASGAARLATSQGVGVTAGEHEGDEGRTRLAAPGLLAANGDVVVDVLLQHLRRSNVILGMVLSDHVSGSALLRQGRVLLAGSHAGVVAQADAGKIVSSPKAVRLHLVAREVGLATSKAHPLRRLRAVQGKRIATRPATAGLRKRLDDALSREGISARRAFADAVEYACHKDVALAVVRGEADVGLTTHAWARLSGLSFLPIGQEDYDLCFAADHLDDPRVVAACDVAQSSRFRRELRTCAGYAVTKTGNIRAG